MMSKIKKLSEPLSRRINLMIDFCKVTMVNDKKKTQTFQCPGLIHDDYKITNKINIFIKNIMIFQIQDIKNIQF